MTKIFKKYFLILFIAYIIVILCQTVLIDSGTCKKAPKTTPITGDPHERTVNLSMHISVNNSSFYRGEPINISYTLRGEMKGLKSRSVSDINGLVFVPQYIYKNKMENLELNKFKYDRDLNIIKFNRDVNTNKSECCNYIGIISYEAKPGRYDLADTIGDNWDWRRRGNNKLNITKNEEFIEIKNNIPMIYSANVIIPTSFSSSILPCNDTNMLIYKFIGEPIELKLEVQAFDEENDTLVYNWIMNNISDTANNKAEPIIIETPLKDHIYILNAINLTPGEKYSFNIIANDPYNGSQIFKANISYNNRVYDNIYVPLSHPKVPIVIYLIFILILCIIGVKKDLLYNITGIDNSRLKNAKLSTYIDEAFLILMILVVTVVYMTVYFHGYEYISPFYKSDDLMVYLKSLNLFEIYVYLMVFIVIVYFTEACFGQQGASEPKKRTPRSVSSIADSIKLITVSRLWITNSIFMLAVLLSLDAIILRANEIGNPQDWLINYYGEMGEIFATILAIIAAFYTSIPQNIINSKWVRVSQGKNYFRYLHTKILHYFLVLYGVIVALSIWGFSFGLTVDFPPLVDINRDNIFFLLSIAVFETTLLLVPPAITCLYEMLRSILFTGNVELKSKPSGAKIFVDETDTCLLTPTVLMLPNGNYKISLQKEGYMEYELKGEREDGKICVFAGTKQEYECKLKGGGLPPLK